MFWCESEPKWGHFIDYLRRIVDCLTRIIGKRDHFGAFAANISFNQTASKCNTIHICSNPFALQIVKVTTLVTIQRLRYATFIERLRYARPNYTSLVVLFINLEYASPVWSPHQKQQISKLENIQKRRWITTKWENPFIILGTSPTRNACTNCLWINAETSSCAAKPTKLSTT